MSRIRVEQEGIEKRQAVIRSWEQNIIRWELAIQDRERPSVRALIERVALAQKSAEDGILGLAMNPGDPERDKQTMLHLGGQLKLAMTIVGDFKNAEKNIETARHKISDLKYEIEQAKETGVLSESTRGGIR